MKKTILTLSMLLCMMSYCHAQQRNINLEAGAEGNLPVFQNDHGGGIFIKGLLYRSENHAFTISAGASFFRAVHSVERDDVKTGIGSLLLGYRKSFNRIFFEPQLGISSYRLKISNDSTSSTTSPGALTGSASMGYTIKRFNAGIRFTTLHAMGENRNVSSQYKNFHYTSIFLSYHLL